MIESAYKVLGEHGIVSRIARHTGIARCNISLILHGARRATVRQAALLEEEFVKIGVPLNRWDLLYGMEDKESIPEYLKRKVSE